ncbi:YchJ family metal-binding protein [Dyadobacter sp. LHD-138]|uniref:YchJ family protein n=1 Tax=Dyadobacter sp. LHD-138 TaxID=3071413 RepID=UPI0027E06696|nr:YchJ family metal-binding protein [Dyadobacter sp. LHD-138]MDQ6479108.1 YchJ family metal-binding protein [Dyadobacter sp. LHD-138]
MKTCFCGSDQPYSRCCGPVIKGTVKATSAEKLMRSRYSAYVMAAVDYLVDTTHHSKRAGLDKKDIENWAKTNSWQKLEIVNASTFSVEFKAYFRDRSGKKQVHHEKSAFVFENDSWYYVDGVFNEDI